MLQALQELIGLQHMKAAPKSSGCRAKVIWINKNYVPQTYYSLKR